MCRDERSSRRWTVILGWLLVSALYRLFKRIERKNFTFWKIKAFGLWNNLCMKSTDSPVAVGPSRYVVSHVFSPRLHCFQRCGLWRDISCKYGHRRRLRRIYLRLPGQLQFLRGDVEAGGADLLAGEPIQSCGRTRHPTEGETLMSYSLGLKYCTSISQSQRLYSKTSYLCLGSRRVRALHINFLHVCLKLSIIHVSLRFEQ